MKDYMYEQIKNKILTFDEKILKDLYVISLYVYNLEGDPRHPVVTLGYNTIRNFKKSIKEAFDELEAKWNYAYYLQNEELVIGKSEDEQNMLTNWIKEKNLYFSDQKWNENREKALVLGEQITKQFINILVDVVKKLHIEGIVNQKAHKDLPILIHTLDYDDDTVIQNKLANPHELVKEFTDWIHNN